MVLVKWWPWPPVSSNRYEVSITVRCLKGGIEIEGDRDDHGRSSPRWTVEIRWNGSKSNGFWALSRNLKRDCTREESVGQNGVVQWDEEFRHVCRLSSSPWEVAFTVLIASDQGQKNKLVVVGTTVLNLVSFASIDVEQELEIDVPSTLSSSSVECSPKLCLTLLLRELKTIQEPQKAMHRSLTLPLSAPMTPCFGIPETLEEDESPSLRRAKSLKVSLDNEGLLEDSKVSPRNVGRNSFVTLKFSPKFKMMKKKLSFKSEKVKVEPTILSKKEHGEMGNDNLPTRGEKNKESPMIAEFEDEVGSWESIEVVSRDGLLKLQTQVFFATIDQRSEKASGESACTVLVILLAHWLHSNPNTMPNQSDFDRLIREGSLQWRKLCENESYMIKFPDKHFDLETVLKAEICPISVSSITGFFDHEGMENKEILGFLEESKSFDSIWEEICTTNDLGPMIFIVSWNDHFFVVKVDPDAYYVIDTLGERLHEGCSRAYMLKFDKDTTIRRVPSEEEGSDEGEEEERVVCKGKEACKEYIKSFLAAIRIRELQGVIKEGRKSLKPLHELHLLQIDIHYTQLKLHTFQ